MKKALLIVLGIWSGSCSAQNYLDNYLSGTLSYTTIAAGTDSVAQPRDLDFKPYSNELWVANKGDINGSSMVIVYNAGQANQSAQYRKDSHSSHFMPYGSAIAFGDNGDWASAGESLGTTGPSFMGPALWSGDTSIFARVFQNNWENGKPLGSHIDMLHASPLAMGIAHDSANVYWVSDGNHGHLCRYDFTYDHGPGYDNHADGKIWRYTDIPLTRAVNIPGHMIKDKATGWLYIVDAGTKKLKRVNTATGTVGSTTIPAGELITSNKAVTGATVQVLDSFPASQPSGIDLYNGRLIVSDYSTGIIHMYDASGGPFTKMGAIATGQPGIMGVRIGPDGKIWFVNSTQNTVVRINPATVPNNDAAIDEITAPVTSNTKRDFYSVAFNQCAGLVAPVVVLKNSGAGSLRSATISYRIDNGTVSAFNWTGSLAAGGTTSVALPASPVTDSSHKLIVWVDNPNGNTDTNPANDRKDGAFRALAMVASYPFFEGFPTYIPPVGWFYIGYNFNNKMGWDHRVGGFGKAGNVGSMVMDNSSSYVDISGQIDYLMMPRLNMSGAASDAKLSFDVAYSQVNNTTNDALSVKVSKDCGDSWIEIFGKSGAALATAPAKGTGFSPADTQWRTEVIPLSAYAGQSDVMLMFVFTSAHGNNVFLDNVRVASTVGVEPLNATQVSIYPNPTSGKVSVSLNNTAAGVRITVIDMMGQELKSINNISAGATHSFDLSELPAGTYFIRVVAGEQVYVKKISLVK